MNRYFTVKQATELLPRVERRLRDALLAHREYQRADEEFREFQKRILMLGGAQVNREKVTKIVASRGASATILKQEMAAIEEMGVQVKDLEVGLIDFPTLYRGEEVLLCWKFGEAAIEFWHGLTEGFRGRRPIDEEFLAAHRGEVEQ